MCRTKKTKVEKDSATIFCVITVDTTENKQKQKKIISNAPTVLILKNEDVLQTTVHNR